MTSQLTQPKIAIVHDFFYQNAGAELVVEKLAGLYPNAIIYGSIFVDSKFQSSPNLHKAFVEKRVRTTWIQKLFELRGGKYLRFFKHLFWLYPILMSFVRVEGFDKVIISSTNCGKNIRIIGNPEVFHYCHTPTRYLYNLSNVESQLSLGLSARIIYKILIPILRLLDQSAIRHLDSKKVTTIANSLFIKDLIKKCYNQDSVVIYPPVDKQFFQKIIRKPSSYFLCHGRISFHKRIDLAIEACLNLGIDLKISGTSALESELESLKSIVTRFQYSHPESATKIEFLGRTTNEELCDLISGAKGFLFPGREDFGISPVEMFAAGLPVVAYKEGGALEYIREGENGVFFAEQNVKSLIGGILEFQKLTWSEEVIKKSSESFGTEIFEQKIKSLIG